MVKFSKISFILTLIIHISVTGIFKLLDNFSLIISFFFVTLICGFVLRFNSKSSLKKIGLGLIYGSITSLLLIGGFMIWLELNYPE
jgi:hypothetical protein